jgi:hypothetical protein
VNTCKFNILELKGTLDYSRFCSICLYSHRPDKAKFKVRGREGEREPFLTPIILV